MTVSTGRESDKFMLRFPEGMRDRIRAEAEQNNRSMNAEIIHRLQTTLEMDTYEPQVNAHAETEDDAFNRARSLLNEVDALLANANKLRKSKNK
ncbi:Arc family DNA-binding protein [Ochrobactrum sp. Marseille-Q0166]|uniref:Arc family DNA-binding protein n=1 Tax=Ochrobactrum sp. Marseille-Q0166 TaxID=2761105 RepID=UPI001655D010|nr:Arc family DNA-binding protein [Ochrobactrum sp. Marseille-Q0166]MBC8718806.1 Arc family DNA-binding protein [Ochrobactrum sp. Marseille-Q0166]